MLNRFFVLIGMGFSVMFSDLWALDEKPILPNRAVLRIGTTAFRYGERILAIAVSPDGTQVASSSDNGYLRIWDVSSGKERWVFQKPGQKLTCFDFSSGKRVHQTEESPSGLGWWHGLLAYKFHCEWCHWLRSFAASAVKGGVTEVTGWKKLKVCAGYRICFVRWKIASPSRLPALAAYGRSQWHHP